MPAARVRHLTLGFALAAGAGSAAAADASTFVHYDADGLPYFDVVLTNDPATQTYTIAVGGSDKPIVTTYEKPTPAVVHTPAPAPAPAPAATAATGGKPPMRVTLTTPSGTPLGTLSTGQNGAAGEEQPRGRGRWNREGGGEGTGGGEGNGWRGRGRWGNPPSGDAPVVLDGAAPPAMPPAAP